MTDRLVGKVLDQRYRLHELLGKGGMGKVYRADQLAMGRSVAVKVLNPELAGDEVAVARFFREVRAGSTLNHPNIVTVYDFGRAGNDLIYMAMELLEGDTLAALKNKERPTLKSTCHIGAQVCDALVPAHDKGIIHRDLKPSNIFVLGDVREGVVKVVDFGIAKIVESKSDKEITKTGVICGTPGFMSPEQASGLDLDPRSDLYSVGVILYELVTGVAPFEGTSPVELLVKHMHEPPRRVEELVGEGVVPVALSDLIHRCLAKRPADRPRSAMLTGRTLREIGAALTHQETLAARANRNAERATTMVESLTDWVGSDVTPADGERLLSPDFLKPGGLVLGRFRVLEEVGSGPGSRVYKAADTKAGNQSVALKVIPGFGDMWKRESLVRLRHHAALLGEPAPAGVLVPIQVGIEESLAIIATAYCEGGSLAARLRRFGRLLWRDTVHLGLDICRALGSIHELDLYHRNVKPANLLYRQGAIRLSDFGLSVLKDPGEVDPAQDGTGTFAYMAPEEGGMIARAVDGRTDLYALGVVLYECLTGEMPFAGASPWQILRAKVSVEPDPPSSLAGDIPESLDEIVVKLLRPLPEARYQSVQGVLADLEAVLKGREDDFELGRHDVVRRLGAEGRLVGRDVELAELTHRAKTLATGTGAALLITGTAGMGKSRLAREGATHMRAQGSKLLAAKGHKLGARTPFGAVLELFGELLRMARSMTRAEREELARSILEACGGQAGVLTALVPPLAALLGKQPTPVQLEPEAEKIRLHRVLGSALLAVASAEAPLCVLLDDIQWLDDASAQFVRYLVPRVRQQPALLLMTVNNDRLEEVEDIWWAEDDARLVRVDLHPLRERDVLEYMQDRLGASAIGLEALATQLYQRSAGVPRVLKELLPALHERGVVHHESGEWHIQLENLQALRPGEIGIELLRDRLAELSPEARTALATAALLGPRFRAKWVADLTGYAIQQVHHLLLDAERQGFLLSRRAESGIDHDFVDDRLREAAADYFPAASRRQHHLRIASLLPNWLGNEDLDLQTVAWHLLEGEAGSEAVETLSQAAHSALARFAPLSAARFGRAALERMPDAHPERAELHLLVGRAYRMLGEPDEADPALRQAVVLSVDRDLKVRALHELAHSHRVQGDVKAALAALDEALAFLQVTLPRSPLDRRTTTWRLLLRHLFTRTFKARGSGIDGSRYATASQLLMMRGEILFFVDQSAGLLSALLALDYARRGDDPGQLAYTLSAMSAVIGMGGGLLGKGLDWSAQALDLSRRSGSRLLEARAAVYRLMMGVLSCREEKMDLLADETLMTARAVGDHWLIAVALEGKGELEFLRGNLVAHHHIARQLRAEMLLSGETRQMIAWSYSISSWCANDMGMWETALGLTRRTLQVAEDIGDRLTAFLGRCNRLIALAQLDRLNDAWSLASELFIEGRPGVPRAYLTSGLRRACSACITAFRASGDGRWRKLSARLVNFNIRQSRPYPSRLTEAYLLKAEFLAADGATWRARRAARKALHVSKRWKHSRDYRVGQILLLLAELYGGTATPQGRRYLAYAEKKLGRTNGPTVSLLKLYHLMGRDYVPTHEELLVQDQLRQLSGRRGRGGMTTTTTTGTVPGATTPAEDSERLRAARQNQSMTASLKALTDYSVAPNERISRALQYVLDLVGAERAAFLVPGLDEEEPFRVLASAGTRRAVSSGPFFQRILSMCRQAMSTGTPQILSQEPTATGLGDSPLSVDEVHEAVALPVRSPAGMVGALYADNMRPTGLLGWGTVMLLDSLAPHFGEVLNARSLQSAAEVATQPESDGSEERTTLQQRVVPQALLDLLPDHGLKRLQATVVCARLASRGEGAEPEQVHAAYEKAAEALEPFFERFGGAMLWSAFGIIGGLVPVVGEGSHGERVAGLLSALRGFFAPTSSLPGLSGMAIQLTGATGYLNVSLQAVDGEHSLVSSGRPADRALSALFQLQGPATCLDETTATCLADISGLSLEPFSDHPGLYTLLAVDS